MAVRRLAALFALVLAATVAACSPGAGTGGQLEGTKWVLDAYADGGQLTIVDEALYADAEFTASRVTGFAGCNQFNAVYRAGGRTLLITQPSVTLKACADDVLAFEQAYLAALDASRYYSVRRDVLTIFDGDRNTVLRFDAAPRNPLLGAWQVDSFETAPSTVSAVLEGTRLDVVFRIGSVGGFAGCNSFTGAYGTNGSVVRVGRLAMTRLACDEDVMAQEAAFVSALEGVSMIEPRGSYLNLTDRGGALKIALVRPAVGEAASPPPEPTEEPVATPTERQSKSPTPSPAPTATPTPRPTATAAPTPAPTTAPTAAPSRSPLPSLPPIPPTASCELATLEGVTVAAIVYPGSWYTLDAPPSLACRLFDPEEILVAADAPAPTTAVSAAPISDSYDDAVAAASDPATWAVSTSGEAEEGGVAITCIDAVAVVDTGGVSAGDARYVCLADVGAAGTVALQTVGTPGDETYLSNAAVVTLMTLSSEFEPGS